MLTLVIPMWLVAAAGWWLVGGLITAMTFEVDAPIERLLTVLTWPFLLFFAFVIIVQDSFR